MNGWVLLAIAVVVLVVVVVRRVRGEPLNARDLWVPPVVLTGIGLWILAHTSGLRPADHTWLLGGALLGVTLGYLRGRFVVVFARAGFLWQRYTGRTFAVVAGTLLLMAAFGLLATRLGMRPEARPIQLSIGLSFLGESLAVTLRGRSLGVPFAPERS
ncbi:DUF1453 domain-containing protein [Actinoplanes awajinensis]|uniref:DUF1453 domain-containing protein n=1 Tax=Actinoplanes awajinensis subsp. mycoplanecinus TaxID=135947 RepID=A0A0X3V7W0_9ACTN|nr:DUF1453 domain-containing protein [Actinoplanes awajinensis]KUL40893.1 hypothetical protein ADL15_05745 [Actinoplanes awajinensis subsp. mycoplanecinus]